MAASSTPMLDLRSRGRLKGEGAASATASFVFEIGPRRIGQLAVQRFPVSQASTQEFWPRRHRDFGRNRLGQQSPKLGMMPAKIVAGAVAVRANAGPQTFHLSNKSLAVPTIEVMVEVHADLLRM